MELFFLWLWLLDETVGQACDDQPSCDGHGARVDALDTAKQVLPWGRGGRGRGFNAFDVVAEPNKARRDHEVAYVHATGASRRRERGDAVCEGASVLTMVIEESLYE